MLKIGKMERQERQKRICYMRRSLCTSVYTAKRRKKPLHTLHKIVKLRSVALVADTHGGSVSSTPVVGIISEIFFSFVN